MDPKNRPELPLSESWNDEIRSAIRCSKELLSFLSDDYSELQTAHSKNFPLFIPLKLAMLIKNKGPQSALWRQFVPHSIEDAPSNGQDSYTDPIGDQVHMQQGQLIHRYRNRALFLPTSKCPVICRYCFRKNELYDPKLELLKPNFKLTKNYILEHPEIEEIIFSGGDPLMLSNSKINFYAQEFHTLDINFLRFHTRFPIIIPSRIDSQFCLLMEKLESKYKRVSLAIHVNHIEELDRKDVLDAIKRLKKTGIQLLSQTVLLNGINDCPQSLKTLFLKLGEIGITPYYLHHPDKVSGGEHFLLSIERGRNIYQQLQGELPGWCLPKYILDIPHGHGKVQIHNSENLAFSGEVLDRKLQPHSYNEIMPNFSPN